MGTIIGIWVAGLCVGIGFGITIGKYSERRNWNKLIEKGVIPRPSKKK